MKQCLLLITILYASVIADAQQLSQSVTAVSAATYSAPGFTLEETVGEMAAVETFNSGHYFLCQGFEQGSPLILAVDLPDNKLITAEVFPNPATDYIEVRLDQDQKISSLEITDILGNPVLSGIPIQKSGNGIHINLRGLPAGLYFLRIKFPGTSSALQTITKSFTILH